MISNQKLWDEFVEKNQDGYGGACINVARKVMEYLDRLAPENDDFDPHSLICKADDESKTGGITLFMAGAVADMVSQCHSRGKEFRKKWNKIYGTEDEDSGTLNPAILTIETKE